MRVQILQMLRCPQCAARLVLEDARARGSESSPVR